jgi:signal transduction histidine kinase
VTSQPEPGVSGIAGFRMRLLVAMMLVVSVVAFAGLLFAQRKVAENVRRDFDREFQGELAAVHAVQDARHAAIAERCRALARRPRIHAALEDGAPDLLYPSARDEMQDVMSGDGGAGSSGAYALHARFYRFLDINGRVIAPPEVADVGELGAGEASELALGGLPTETETGYVARGGGDADGDIDEVIAMPIVSTEDGEIISAIELGFKLPGQEVGRAGSGIVSGVLLKGSLELPSYPDAIRRELEAEVSRAISADKAGGSIDVNAAGVPYLMFYKWLNPGSLFPAAYEVSLYPLGASVARQRTLLWQFAGAALLLILGAYGVSGFLSARLSESVEKLAIDSEENSAQRRLAEAALESTGRELQRSARFSADASHQLKTPVTVLRAGLEELLAGEHLSPAAREEVSSLVHQTFRLASVIEDLLLLSRMDGGRLQIQFTRVDLGLLLEAWLDDHSAHSDQFELAIVTRFSSPLWINGEKRYAAIILQNLLENARKYNRQGGRIRISARTEGECVYVTIGNTGSPIPPSAQEHVFERFHRGEIGENVPGHGIGLNLARELARLHGGELRLAKSGDDWTEFELRFRSADGGGEKRESA